MNQPIRPAARIAMRAGARPGSGAIRWVALLLALIASIPAARAETRCAIGAPGATRMVPIAATGRPMLLRRPAGLDRAEPAPLLFVLHGSTGTGVAILRDSKLEATADRHGFILAAPDAGIRAGNGFVWNIPDIPTVTGAVPGPDDPDDVAYLAAAIDWLVAQGCVDRTRVYATGLSGGGRMASWLGCVAADRFAAIAPVVGLRAGNPLSAEPARPDPATCRPSRPMPVIAFAGAADTTNPIDGGGAGYWRYSMHAAEQRWAALNGCAQPVETRWIAAGIYEEGYRHCRDGAVVIGRITVGGAHAWVADNDALWAFVSAHRR